MRHREFSGRREHGLQRRLSPVGALAADWGLRIAPDAEIRSDPDIEVRRRVAKLRTGQQPR
jgi:hypothetical protein